MSSRGEIARGELLLELLSEEIPAGMQTRAIESLTALLRDKLAAAEIPAASIRGYVTPRRLAVIAEGIPATQPDRTEERRGPRLGAPAQAIDGFLRSAGLASLTECEVRNTGRGEFYFAVVKRRGRPAAEVLPELVKAAMVELPWPKSMRYPASALRWIRPLRSVVCLFDGDVLPLSLDGIAVGRITRGHRFLSPREICVRNAAEYPKKLYEAQVVLDQYKRKERMRRDLERLVADEGLVLKDDAALLDEVNGLVEWPVVLMGRIDAEFMVLPPEVLATAMRAHQKYFSCLTPDGAAAPRFLFVANNRSDDGGKAIIAGNERVLRARLADARFFWEQDRKIPLKDRDEALKTRLFYEGLGSVYDKVQRVAFLVDDLGLANAVGADAKLARRAARLAKSDLSTLMVGEFPELQGIMGRYYAINDREDPKVARAIAEHYKPQGPNDTCPTAPESVAVALAEKIDSLVVFFAIGEKPTGSRDPFALRRAALGIIRLILKNKLRLQLREIFENAWMGAINNGGSDPTTELLEFIADRLKVHLREEGMRHDLIAAASIQTTGIPEARQIEDDLVRLVTRARALESFIATDDGANLLVAYRRAANIVAIEDTKDGQHYGDRAPDSTPGMLKLPEERHLNDRLLEARHAVEAAGEDFRAAMAELARLRQPVDAFFDKVTVNADDAKLRVNRLRLLSAIRAVMNQVADFSQIEG
jgi:glycyl-tRNA synthetase beta chain